ncbi:MAG TPA: hypothetical protein VM889_06970 [Candidatus Thermoplasmatota archaeon]|nr:hypothetical protein [Candidatus Thermoplasmatota archaeon]
MLIRIGCILVLLMTTVPLARADAGDPDDAGNTWSAARNVSAASFAGTLPVGDIDWYRIVVAPGQTVAFYVDYGDWGAMGAEIRDDRGERLAYGDDTASRRIFVFAGSDDGPLRLGIWNGMWNMALSYTVTWELRDGPDLAVAAVRVDPRPLQTLAGPVPGLHREVAIDVINEGILGSDGALLTAWIEHEDPNFSGVRFLGSAPVTLKPGQASTVRFHWDATGEWGDVTIVADIHPSFDADWRDNRLRVVTSTGILPGSPGGDALNRKVAAGYPTYHAIEIKYENDYKGVTVARHVTMGAVSVEVSTRRTGAWPVYASVV